MKFGCRDVDLTWAFCAEVACVWWQSSSVAANPVARGTELAMSLRVKGWLFFPALSPPLLPLPHPCGKHTLGSAGPALRSSLPAPSCCRYHTQSLPGREAHHPVRKRCCCCCCLCREFPENMEKKGRREKEGRKREKKKEGKGNRNGGGEEGGEDEKRSYPKKRTFIIGWKREGGDYLHWVLISRAPYSFQPVAYSTLCSQPLPCKGGRKSVKSTGTLLR